jgi:hypothetical protein
VSVDLSNYVEVHERIKARSVRVGECLIWQGSIGSHGYGQISHRSRPVLVHRIAYIAERGAIPDGFVIDHLCRNKACVDPEHMEAVTNAVNTQRGTGARFTPEDIREIREAPGSHAAAARRWDTSRGAIANIRNGRTWANA